MDIYIERCGGWEGGRSGRRETRALHTAYSEK